jgi:hypothetical protein
VYELEETNEWVRKLKGVREKVTDGPSSVISRKIICIDVKEYANQLVLVNKRISNDEIACELKISHRNKWCKSGLM